MWLHNEIQSEKMPGTDIFIAEPDHFYLDSVRGKTPAWLIKEIKHRYEVITALSEGREAYAQSP